MSQAPHVITIVSGLPRSGTSLMMQMLSAGGMPILTDGERSSDADNPRGYCEWEPVKLLPGNPDLIAQAEDKAVKIISQLLFVLPAWHDYRVIFMSRPLSEVLASQSEMLRRRGQSGPAPPEAKVSAAFEHHLIQVKAWLTGRRNIAVAYVEYHDLLREPRRVAETLGDFLSARLDVEAMARQVDPALYRQRASQTRNNQAQNK
jgi:hypothetical protein